MATARVAVGDVVHMIRSLDAEFMEAVAAKDAARLAAVYAKDARLLMPGRTLIRGRPEIFAFWKAALAGPVAAIALNTTEIEISGDLAFGVGNSTITLTRPGKPPREEKGKYVGVYRREPRGDWKLLVDSYCNDE